MDDGTVFTLSYSKFVPNKPKEDACWNGLSCRGIVVKDKKKGNRQCSICKGYVCLRCDNCHCTNPLLPNKAQFRRNKEEARKKLCNPFSLDNTEMEELHKDFERVFRLKLDRFLPWSDNEMVTAEMASKFDTEMEELFRDFECVYGSYAKIRFEELCKEFRYTVNSYGSYAEKGIKS